MVSRRLNAAGFERRRGTGKRWKQIKPGPPLFQLIKAAFLFSTLPLLYSLVQPSRCSSFFPGGHPSWHYPRRSTLNPPSFGLARISRGSRAAFGGITPVRGVPQGALQPRGPHAALRGSKAEGRQAWARRGPAAADSGLEGGGDGAGSAGFVSAVPPGEVWSVLGNASLEGLRGPTRAQNAPQEEVPQKQRVTEGGGAKRGATRGLPRRSPILVLLSPKHA